jgi:hypothetical protein
MPYPALLVVLALVTLILWGIIFGGKGRLGAMHCDRFWLAFVVVPAQPARGVLRPAVRSSIGAHHESCIGQNFGFLDGVVADEQCIRRVYK